MPIDKEKLDEINKLINQEEDLAVMMVFTASNSSKITGRSNARELHDFIDYDFDLNLTNQILNHLMQKRLALQVEILKYVSMKFREEKVFITKKIF